MNVRELYQRCGAKMQEEMPDEIALLTGET
uniref:Uncharacterized protein n=1 Tax=Siphoviridae sp. ctHAs12 TaxID=2827826 RepID=A0A8S5SJ10_9CAUD|nr:MAG TPA: hypothetical protein [Siphoviridae sp. ctHAs12]DAU03443.1 MAG TPA: hypothetical protein [Caudoviricetes sp.]